RHGFFHRLRLRLEVLEDLLLPRCGALASAADALGLVQIVHVAKRLQRRKSKRWNIQQRQIPSCPLEQDSSGDGRRARGEPRPEADIVLERLDVSDAESGI